MTRAMKYRALAASPFVLASLLVLAHCGSDDTSGGGDTSDAGHNGDATSGNDAGGNNDAGHHDAGSDATTPDANGSDANGSDSTAPDANEGDASDAGTNDTGTNDAGTSDASDAGSTDASDGGAICAFDETSDGAAHLLAIYTLPFQSMKNMVPSLTDGDLDAALQNGLPTVNDLGPGSGLEYAGGCTFYGIGDRGPNGSSNVDKNGVSFPMPKYTPTVMKLRMDPPSGTLLVDGVVNALTDGGAPATGISNDTNDDTPYATATATTPMPYVQSGLDTEDVRRLPNGDLAFCEEYGPSLGIIDGTTGQVKVRYVPSTVSLPNAGYPVKGIVPAVFTQRRVNKGFEGLAVSPDGHTAYAILQTPMGDETTYGTSLVGRVVRIEHFDDPASAVVTGHFVVLHQAGSLFSATKQSKVFYNSGAWLANDKLLLLERAAGHLHLVVADFSGATNLVGHPELGEGDLSPESTAADAGYAKLGIVPAATTDVFTSDDVPAFITSPPDGGVVPDKLEGLAIINKTTVAIANDNDFGISNANDPTRIWILRLKAPLPQ
jgi:alkaline phosphatase